jgi:hypothetical protein
MVHIRGQAWVVVFIGICLLAKPIEAQTQEFVPLDSWVYPVMEELRVRGHTSALWGAVKPYTRADVIRALEEVRRKVDAGETLLTKLDQVLVQRLAQEFDNESTLLGVEKKFAWRFRAFGQERLSATSKEKVSRVAAGSNIGLHFGQRATFYDEILIDQEMAKDPAYTGYLWRGMHGDFDAAYAQVALGPTRMFVGRGKLFWGPGRSESLILSSNAPALDRLGLDVRVGPWAFSWFTAELDPLKHYQRPDTTLREERAKRFVTGHRLDVKIGRSLELGASETFVYGGPGREFELHYLNPLLLYHAVQLNDDSPGNTMLGFDGRWLMWPKWEVYGEVLIDDWQIEHKTPQDEEPSHWGMQVGLRAADPLGLKGSYAWANYSRVNNWVYNVYQPYERYNFKGKSLGWSGGNDGDVLELSGIKHLNRTWDVGLMLSQRRHGEGRLDATWPFVVQDKDTLIKRGFRSEPFPSGIVEKKQNGEISLRWQPNADSWLELGAGVEGIRNEGNVKGSDRTSATARLVGRYQVDWLFR